jgi:hypothetical protein
MIVKKTIGSLQFKIFDNKCIVQLEVLYIAVVAVSCM